MDEQEPIEFVEAERTGVGHIPAQELCLRLGVSQDVLELCVRWEVVEPLETGAEGTLFFTESSLERMRRGLRLHHDLGINWQGVAVVLDLLDRIETLEQAVQLRQEEP
jgi:DNA-binding transcriptional MerR regulator